MDSSSTPWDHYRDAECTTGCGRVDGLVRHAKRLFAEVKEWQQYWRTTEPAQSSSSPNLAECLERADEDIFPNIRTLLRIGCTLPVGSCEAERSFSCLRRIKTSYATGWGRYRLSGFTLMNMSMDIDLETICQMFIERNKRKCSQATYCTNNQRDSNV